MALFDVIISVPFGTLWFPLFPLFPLVSLWFLLVPLVSFGFLWSLLALGRWLPWVWLLSFWAD